MIKINVKLKIVKQEAGQAMITLLFFIVISVIITSAAVIIITINSTTASKVVQGSLALSIAESGMENAVLRILRNPDYTGETLSIGNGSAIISVSRTEPKIAISEGRLGNFVRKIQAQIGYTDNILTIESWKEVF